MTQATVGVIGFDAIGCRAVDALALQPDLRVAGVVESSPLRRRLLAERGIEVVSGDIQGWASRCDALIVCRHEPRLSAKKAVYAPGARLPGVPLVTSDTMPSEPHVRVACADAIAVARLAETFPDATRILSSSAGQYGRLILDALEPIFREPEEDAEVQSLVATSRRPVFIRRTRVPYSHSHVHHVKLNLENPVTVDAAVQKLQCSRRIRVAAGKTAFANTGLLQEYERDIGRSRGDRPEMFIWAESVVAAGPALFLTMDVDPLAAVVPEIIDAVRFLTIGAHTLDAARAVTDEALAIGGRS